MLVEAILQGALGEIEHLAHRDRRQCSAPRWSTLGDLLCDVHVVSNIDSVALERPFLKCDPAKR